MSDIGTLPGERLAGLSADLFHKVQKGIISLDELNLFVQRKNPFDPNRALAALEKNEHGHFVVTITGLDLSGADEIKLLEAAKYRVSDYAKSCFKNTKADGYDKSHHLVAGQAYKIALVPGKEIAPVSDRTTANLQKLGEKYGYGKSLAGIIPRIRETVSDAQMEAMGIWYIAGLHDTIKDSGGDPGVLSSRRRGEGRWVGAYFDEPGSEWRDEGAFAFLVPAS